MYLKSSRIICASDCDIEELYHASCENLIRDVEFCDLQIPGNGGFGIIADGHHEASALCFKHIWQVCVDKLKDDLVIMVPAKDTILFAPASQKTVVEKMVEHGGNAYEQSKDKVSKTLIRFSKDRKELTAYED